MIKRTMAFLLAAVVLLCGVPASALRQSSSGGSENLAYGKRVWASSEYESEVYQSPKLVDGDPATGWSSAGVPPHWFCVDLGREYVITSVELVTRQDYNQPETRQNFEVRASNDSTFSSYTVLGRQGMESVGYQENFVANVADENPYRYIQVAKTDSTYFFMSELMVYGREATDSGNLKTPPSYSDMAGRPEENAAKLLYVLGVMEGYGDNAFCPDKLLTRAESAQMICGMLNAAPIGGRGMFRDVPASYWGCAPIETLAALGIVNGAENGNFYPENHVTGTELVKMLVCALGYEEIARQKGGYPSGYLQMGGMLGLNTGQMNLSAKLTRAQAAELLVDALLAAPAENVGVRDGNIQMEARRGNTLLQSSFDVTRAKGRVTAVGETDLVTGSALAAGTVEIDHVLYRTAQKQLLALLGKDVTFYCRTNSNGEKEALLLVEAGRYEELTVLAEDIIPGNDWNEFSYFENGKVKIVPLARGIDIVYNGRLDNGADAESLAPEYGEVCLVGGEDGWQLVQVTEYKTVVVDRVSTDNSGRVTVYNKLGAPIVLETEAAGCYTVFEDKDGGTLSHSALEEWDVLLHAASLDGKVNRLVAANDTYSGVIEGISYQDTNGLVPETITINGEELEVSVSYQTAMNENHYGVKTVRPGDTAVLHLDAYGKVAAASDENSADGGAVSYGYVAAAGVEQGVSARAKLRLYTDRMEEVYCSEDVTVNGVKADGSEVVEMLRQSAVNGPVAQLIRYQRGSDGTIRKIYTENYNGTDYPVTKDIVQTERYYVAKVNAFYDMNQSVPDFFSDGRTAIFEVPEYNAETTDIMSDGEYYKRYGASGAVDYQHYYAEGYNLDEAKMAGAIVMYNKSPFAGDGAETDTYGPLIVVDKVTEGVDDEGNPVNRLYAYLDGKAMNYDVHQNVDLSQVKFTTGDGSVTHRRAARGDVLRVSASGNMVTSAVMIFCAAQPLNLQNGKNWDATSVYPPVCRVSAGVISRVLGEYVELAVGDPAGGVGALATETYRYTEASVMLYDTERDKLSVLQTPELQNYLYENNEAVRIFARTNMGVLQTVLIIE